MREKYNRKKVARDSIIKRKHVCDRVRRANETSVEKKKRLQNMQLDKEEDETKRRMLVDSSTCKRRARETQKLEDRRL